MNASMMILDEHEMTGIEGGNPFAGVAIAAIAYTNLLTKIEDNPDDYTFLMDWYYKPK
jgi:hypothetical protein